MPAVLPLILADRRKGRIRPALEPIRHALRTLGDPQSATPSILVVGTNGKGSTAAMLEAVLRSHGLRTGLATSPHLVSVRERIRIDGRPVGRAELEAALEALARFRELTFFELLTAAAFLVFAEQRVDVAVLEAGMGGTWDATRVAGSTIAGITNVGSDHAGWLGATAEERARDKGGALRAAQWAVIGPDMAPELVAELGAPHAVNADTLVAVTQLDHDRIELRWNRAMVEIEPPLEGEHQLGNLQLALALARCAVDAGMIERLDSAAVAAGLADVRWPGRLSRCSIGSRSVLLDGAHNLEGARALAAELGARRARYNLLFGCLDDKPVEAMADLLRPVVADVVICPLDDERAMSPARIAAAFGGARIAAGMSEALALLDDPVVAAGSLRLVGGLLELAAQGDAS